MDTLPKVGDKVKIIDAPAIFKHLIGVVGQVYHIGTSGETAAVGTSVGQGAYFTKEQLEKA